MLMTLGIKNKNKKREKSVSHESLSESDLPFLLVVTHYILSKAIYKPWRQLQHIERDKVKVKKKYVQDREKEMSLKIYFKMHLIEIEQFKKFG